MPASSSSHDLTETAPLTERLTADLGDPELGESVQAHGADTKPGEAGSDEAKLHDSKLGDADDDEATEVMGRVDLPDFEESPRRVDAENRPPLRPSTFTRLLINPRRM